MKKLILIILSLFMISCKNHYNDTMHWMQNIPENTRLIEVKDNQPHFVEIDWKKPEMIDNREYYTVINIKGSHDILNMSHQLIFENGLYKGFNSHK